MSPRRVLLLAGDGIDSDGARGGVKSPNGKQIWGAGSNQKTAVSPEFDQTAAFDLRQIKRGSAL